MKKTITGFLCLSLLTSACTLNKSDEQNIEDKIHVGITNIEDQKIMTEYAVGLSALIKENVFVGGDGICKFIIKNRGVKPDIYTVSVETSNSSWYATGSLPKSFTVEAGNEYEILLPVHVPNDVSEGTEDTVKMLVKSNTNPLIMDSAKMQVLVVLPDADGDGVSGKIDNCITIYNPDQLDSDNNGVGNICEKLNDFTHFEENDFNDWQVETIGETWEHEISGIRFKQGSHSLRIGPFKCSLENCEDASLRLYKEFSQPTYIGEISAYFTHKTGEKGGGYLEIDGEIVGDSNSLFLPKSESGKIDWERREWKIGKLVTRIDFVYKNFADDQVYIDDIKLQ